MKKMIVALVAMMMTVSVNAQNDNKALPFDSMSRFLELRVDQVDRVKTALAQFDSMMEAFYQLKDASKGSEMWEKIQASHQKTMKKILDAKQFDKYVQMVELTAKNHATRIAEEQTAAK